MRIGGITVLAALAVMQGIAAVPEARAAYVVDLYQDGLDVVGTGSGSLNTVGLTYLFSTSAINSIAPTDGYIHLNDATDAVDVYAGLSGPSSFGIGAAALASSATNGKAVGVQGDFLGNSVAFVPVGYVSGTSLGTSTITFANTTLADLGATPGTYVWTWGSGSDADSFTLNITAVPEPLSIALLGTGLIGLGMARRQRRR